MDFLFWDVDTQVDFLSPQGRLYVPGAEKIIPNLRRLTNHAADHKIPIVSSTDAHVQNDPEFSQYPPHCLAGTRGQKKVEGTLLAEHFTIPNRLIPRLGQIESYPQIVVEKQAFDVFTNPNIDALLKALGKREVVLYGVVTELCVDRAARGLIQRGYRVNLVKDAIQHLNSELGSSTIAYIRQHKGQILSTDEILERLPRTAAA